MRDDPDFVPDLLGSDRHTQIVARWLLTKGCLVKVYPIEVRPDVLKRREYADRGDLEWTTPDNPDRKWIGDVRHWRDLEFTCAEDHKYQVQIVDEKYKIDRPGYPVEVWFNINKSETHMAVVTRKHRDRWKIQTRLDRRKNKMRTNYVVPVHLAEYHPLP